LITTHTIIAHAITHTCTLIASGSLSLFTRVCSMFCRYTTLRAAQSCFLFLFFFLCCSGISFVLVLPVALFFFFARTRSPLSQKKSNVKDKARSTKRDSSFIAGPFPGISMKARHFELTTLNAETLAHQIALIGRRALCRFIGRAVSWGAACCTAFGASLSSIDDR
jgi:hypothetical protein